MENLSATFTAMPRIVILGIGIAVSAFHPAAPLSASRVGAFWNYAVYGAFYHDVDCYIPLNGAFAGIAWQASNSPYVVSRTCALKSF